MSVSSLDTVFYRTLQADLAERIEELKEGLAAGHAQDYADYRWRVGRIKALVETQSTAREAYRKALGLPAEDE